MSGPGIKLTTYFEERDRSGDRLLADALFDVYERHRMRTSVLLRGALGFGRRHELHSDRLLTLSESLPAVSIAIDTRDRIEQALGDVLEVTSHGMITLERAQLALGDDLLRLDIGAVKGAVKLTIYGGRSVRSGGRAGYVAAVDRLRDAGATGASVLLAVDGTLHGERQRARFFARNANVPLMLLAIGSGEALSRALPDVADLIAEPVVTVERVQICKAHGATLGRPRSVPAQDESGLPIWQKIMVHAEEQAKFDGRPLYLEIVRRLRLADAAGVTVLRGVRGFYGDLPAFADSVLAMRRNVPVHVVAVDSPEAVQRWWPIVDELTSTSGLVTSELVPASHALRNGQPRQLRLARTSAANPHRRPR